jgi:hypothetical protein
MCVIYLKYFLLNVKTFYDKQTSVVIVNSAILRLAHGFNLTQGNHVILMNVGDDLIGLVSTRLRWNASRQSFVIVLNQTDRQIFYIKINFFLH